MSRMGCVVTSTEADATDVYPSDAIQKIKCSPRHPPASAAFHFSVPEYPSISPFRRYQSQTGSRNSTAETVLTVASSSGWESPARRTIMGANAKVDKPAARMRLTLSMDGRVLKMKRKINGSGPWIEPGAHLSGFRHSPESETGPQAAAHPGPGLPRSDSTRFCPVSGISRHRYPMPGSEK
jgi:hypothetical protein